MTETLNGAYDAEIALLDDIAYDAVFAYDAEILADAYDAVADTLNGAYDAETELLADNADKA